MHERWLARRRRWAYESGMKGALRYIRRMSDFTNLHAGVSSLAGASEMTPPRVASARRTPAGVWMARRDRAIL
jgi:hypothetical protein